MISIVCNGAWQRTKVFVVLCVFAYFEFWGTSLRAEKAFLLQGTVVSKTTSFRAGTYSLPDRAVPMLILKGKNFQLDLKGVWIVGAGKNHGIGLLVEHARNVTIRHASVKGCLYGVVLEDCENVRVLDSDLSHNGCPQVGTVIDESGSQPQDTWGAGILVRRSHHCVIKRCQAQYAWDGVDLVDSDKCTVVSCELSYNNNWGVHLWKASENTIQGNRAIWCTTGGGMRYQSLSGWSTLDSAGVCIEHESNNNLIADNDLRFGGDGVFIRANEGPAILGQTVPPRHSSDGNRIIGNDCSFSPNNAIEVDLVASTRIEQNNCSFSNYGLWLGYSRNTVVRRNTCLNDTTRAVEIENGQNILFAGNVFGYDTYRRDRPIVYLRQNGRDSTPSGPYWLEDNVFYGADVALKLVKTQVTLRGNFFLSSDLGHRSASSFQALVDADAVSSFNTPAFTVRKMDNGVEAAEKVGLLRVGQRYILPFRARFSAILPVLEFNGIPMWVRGLRADRSVAVIPNDLWGSPIVGSATLRVFDGYGWSPEHSIVLYVPPNQPRITSIYPSKAHLGEIVTVKGCSLSKSALFLNGEPIAVTHQQGNSLQFKVPYSFLTSRWLNLVLVKDGEYLVPPLPLYVEVPSERQPHLISVTFEPKTLHVGELLKITFVLKNSLPVPVPLMSTPLPGFVYDENQSWQTVGYQEEVGHLELAVTSDHPGDFPPGLWPYRFGFGQAWLAPQQSLQVTVAIRVQTPGSHLFRAGLVVGGDRFIDDGVFPTFINVLP